MTTEAGRLELIAELDQATREFHFTTQHLRSAEISLALKHGVSGATVVARIRELRNGVSPQGSLAERAAYLINQSPEAVEMIERLMVATVEENTPPDEVSENLSDRSVVPLVERAWSLRLEC